MIYSTFAFAAVCSMLGYSVACRNYSNFKRAHPEETIDWHDIGQHEHRHITIITMARSKTTEFYVGTEGQECHETYDAFLADRSFRQTMPPYIFYWAPVLLILFRRCGNMYFNPFRYVGDDNVIRSRKE